jgi:uncharacterized protein YbjT (DUF2867 family)
MKTAVLFGASGLVGSWVLDLLLESNKYEKVIIISRKPFFQNHPKLEKHIIDFKVLDQYKHFVQGNDLFYCIGTTLKDAGSKEAFQAIDRDLPVQVGRIARENGIKTFVFISSVGADPNTGQYYRKAKGEAEVRLRRLKLPNLIILRPSLLVGERRYTRLNEVLLKLLLTLLRPFLIGKLAKYRPVRAEFVARAMVKLAQEKEPKLVYESQEIAEIGRIKV